MKKLLLLLPIMLYAQVIDTVIPLFYEPLGSILYIPDGNKLFINIGRTNRFLVFDCSTYTVRKVISIPPNSPTVAYGLYNWRRNKIYYGFNMSPCSIAVIDNRTDSIINWIDFRAGQSQSLCYHSRDDKLYATDGYSVAVIDCATDSTIKIISQPTHNLTHFVVWDSIGNKVYSGSSWTDKVTVIDCANDSVVAVISSGVSTPWSAVYNPQRRKLYVAGEWGHTGAVICTVGDTLIKNFSLYYNDNIPLIYNSLEDKVYWPAAGIYVIDCLSDSIITEITVEDAYPRSMCLANWSNRLYFVTTYWGTGETLRVVNCHNDSVVSKLRIGHLSLDIMTGNPNNQRIYIADMNDSALYVIRDEIPGIEEDRQTLDASSLTPEIYPNPARSFLAIHLPQSADHPMLKIFDISGKLVKVEEKVISEQEHKQEVRISLKGINPGIYFLKLGTEVKKFLIIK